MVIHTRSPSGQGCFRHFVHHCVYTVWKKRPVLLATILVFTVIFVVFQYHTVSKDSDKLFESNARPKPFGISSVEQGEGGGDGPGGGWGGHDESHSGHNGNLNRPPIPKRNLSSVSRQRSPTGISYPYNAPLDGEPDRRIISPNGDGAEGRPETRSIDQGSNNKNFFHNQDTPGHGPIKNVDEYQRMIKEGIDPITGQKKKSPGVPKLRLVHLDLKGATSQNKLFQAIIPPTESCWCKWNLN